ncbi:GGDEF domain-containing protein [Billgrantia kenyensis]|uniref:diguanylate cyclase n=1 Tax=Billgrantia kenyensis TaxID=321266 RepID=A0A7V9W3L4_9GAMM|nr:GGDEF domain-containing protein [Halomonas kenyensis]MBA2780437.1 GGDEF domain-containing protein [Halomonas kenyensis]MCG6663355.1 GGDEF domain-containing protein [Halomonas kenyensis]
MNRPEQILLETHASPADDESPEKGRGPLQRLWRDLLTSGGRTSESCPDYLCITLINLVQGTALLVWSLFLTLILLGPLEPLPGRLAIDVAGLVIAAWVIIGLRRGMSATLAAHVTHAFLFLCLLGLSIVRSDNPLTMTLPLIYPALAFLLLDDIRRGLAGTLLMTAGLNILLSSGMGPTLSDSTMLLDGAVTITVVMLFQAAVMSLYVHHRKQALSLLRRASVRLNELASHDPLTGLYNRRTFIEVLERELSRRGKSERQLAFLLFDIDRFKAYNDEFGHPQGDELLKRLASTATQVFSRREDVVFRLGGEEFGVVFRSESPEQAAEMADQLLAAVEAMEEPAPAGPKKNLTVSAGLYLVAKGGATSPNRIYSRADQALYRAKDAGRACWLMASQ